MCFLEKEKMNSPDAQTGGFQGDQAVNEGFSVHEKLLQNPEWEVSEACI